ncbi:MULTISPECIES: heavy metal-binding domain-containing protein [unclassified Lactobacillus]|uniref:heavy metal-binding domain-containing protein n=1 Tax=unclassified Lactobacillus TaxID=2620435 RepID=UPI0023F7F6F4|nr:MULTISPECIES: heavy metal-binding domain-containing protein [unclassified Lactobacillus]MDF7668853.1 heavy metal-binding domain-containing protein [Lactobacillus sp. ESL0703]WEV38452.1 heavy metal-binding domain-containing protein [Lactobacillus sp. ESL0680]
MDAEQIMVTTTEQIPGKKYEILGEVFGLTTQSKNMIKNIGAGLKSMVGGEIGSYTKMLEESRNKALARMCQAAADKGADAIVMMRFDSGSIASDMQSVVAYGTAVKFINSEE